MSTYFTLMIQTRLCTNVYNARRDLCRILYMKQNDDNNPTEDKLIKIMDDHFIKQI